MTSELPKRYDPASIQGPVYRRWLERRAFRAFPDDRESRYVIMMPLPNVTGALHMGHAMDNVMQDLLIRWHRMLGDNTLWQPGTDHAGIATQAVVEKRLLELEGKSRHDLGRDGLVRRIFEWKDQYQARIVEQQQQMGCSCDWDRQRFTMDPVCTAAVRETFFSMFRDALIYRGTRLVNWDCHLQTAVADDEVEHETVAGHFWHLRYPVIDPEPGEPDHVVVATTRPETMLGDTAVACHPDPGTELGRRIAAVRHKLGTAPAKEKRELENELRRLEDRLEHDLPRLERLAAMAREGRRIRLPLLDREIPLILDAWAKPELGSGCVKITPGHDPNDYEVWQRHANEIGLINILEPDGSLNANAGPYKGQDRFDARRNVVADLEQRGLLAEVDDRQIEIGHSDRSKTPIEPYLSKQWFVRMRDVEGGILLGRGTPRESKATGLAQAAMDAASPQWRSPTGRRLAFHPARYRNTYQSWLAEKRDWCISRQLWWGHRIPIWARAVKAPELDPLLVSLRELDDASTQVRVVGPDGEALSLEAARGASEEEVFDVQVCLRSEEAEARHVARLEGLGLTRDPDVLDTWFSSALWPHSTLGWPDPVRARVEDGQTQLAATEGAADSLTYYYPGSCLVTARDIITLWVARMVVAGLYNLGDLPFTDVFIHANILDGKGERMSKSKGNGIDPADIIERYGADAMRYVLCEMQTGLQDIRLPVQAISPFTGKLVDLASAEHGRSVFTYLDPTTGEEFDALGSVEGLPQAKIISDRFEVGRNFCNKLWNAARFALLNLGHCHFTPLDDPELSAEDLWILSRLSRATTTITDQLAAYNPSAAIGAAREFFWSELCDWYLELIKQRMKDDARAGVARQVLAFVLDQMLRLLHPFLPFITEALWEKLCEQAPERGIRAPVAAADSLILAAWPAPERAPDQELEERFDLLREIIRAVRDLRARHGVPPSKRLEARIKVTAESRHRLEGLEAHLEAMAGLGRLEVSPAVAKPQLAATQIVGNHAIYLCGVLDPAKERARLEKQATKLDGQIRSLESKLANEDFIGRAPQEIVERERTRLVGLREEVARVRQSLAELGD